MNVLVITGDKKFGPGHPRYDLQRSAVDELAVVYWGWGSAGRRMWPKLPSGKFDVVTAQDPFWRGLFAWVVAKRTGARFNVQVHTDLSVYGGIKHVLMQIVLRHADTIRVVTEKIKQQVERIGVKAQIQVLPVYVDVEKFHSVVRRVHDLKNIVWIGRFEEEKNPLQAIEVLQEVLKSVPDAKLIMLGQGSLSSKVAEHAAHLPTHLPGWQDSMLFLDIADVVLCTSWHESFGASIVESLAAGVPVVAPDVGVAKEAGALVVPREQLAATVVDVLKNPQEAVLKLPLLSKEEWVRAWKETL